MKGKMTTAFIVTLALPILIFNIHHDDSDQALVWVDRNYTLATILGHTEKPLVTDTYFINFTKSLPEGIYKYQSPENVRLTANHRFSILDNFVDPNEAACHSAVSYIKPGFYMQTLIIMWIHSAADHFERRQLARKFWASRTIYLSLKINILPLFAIGLTGRESVDHAVAAESRVHGDIVILSYHDSYHNVSYKVVGGMRWVVRYCPQASVFLKIDDDTLVIPTRLAEWFHRSRAQRDRMTISGAYIFENITRSNRNSTSKWHLSPLEWPPSLIAKNGAPGLVYFMSTDILPSMFAAMQVLPWVWLEDVWINGALPEVLARAGVPQYHYP